LAIFGEKDGKIALCLSISNDLINLLDASKLISPMIEKIGGKGGGGKKAAIEKKL
jgi:alanyl-tRNA synthetase